MPAAGSAIGIFSSGIPRITRVGGNDPINRVIADTYTSMWIVDQNNPVTVTCIIRSWDIWADTTTLQACNTKVCREMHLFEQDFCPTSL